MPLYRSSLLLAAVGLLLAAALHSDGAPAGGKPRLSLKGSPSIGAPSTIFVFRAVLTGGEDSEDFYCLTTEWTWEEQADSSLNEAECPPYQAGVTPIERVFTEEQTFQRPGPHLVRIALLRGEKEIASASTTVTVRRVQ